MHEDIDLTDLDRFAAGFPHRVFDTLRRESPVWFHPPTAHSPGGEGFWVLSRYSDIVDAAANADTFSSETGGDREGGGTLRPCAPGLLTGGSCRCTSGVALQVSIYRPTASWPPR